MISVYNIKPWFQSVLNPILVFLHKKNVTANQITITAFGFSFVIGVLFWHADTIHYLFLVLPVGLLIRMALNALDGMMARKYNQVSKKGEVYNELGDVVSDLFVFFPLVKFQSEAIYAIVLFIALSSVNEFAGVLGKLVAGERRYEGPMGKSDRAFILGLYGLVSYFSLDISTYSNLIFYVLSGLVILSTILRINNTLKSIG